MRRNAIEGDRRRGTTSRKISEENAAIIEFESRVNKSLGAQARRYPLGFKPTEFTFEDPEAK